MRISRDSFAEIEIVVGKAVIDEVEKDLKSVQYSKPRAWPMSFCRSCANREGDPILAACSVCRRGKNGRPTQYRRKP